MREAAWSGKPWELGQLVLLSTSPEKYEKRESITFEENTPEWVQGFRDYLENEAVAWGHDYRKRIKDKPLSRKSKVSYFNKLRACLNQAFEERIIAVNPLRGIEGFKAEEGTRMYLFPHHQQ